MNRSERQERKVNERKTKRPASRPSRLGGSNGQSTFAASSASSAVRFVRNRFGPVPAPGTRGAFRAAGRAAGRPLPQPPPLGNGNGDGHTRPPAIEPPRTPGAQSQRKNNQEDCFASFAPWRFSLRVRTRKRKRARKRGKAIAPLPHCLDRRHDVAAANRDEGAGDEAGQVRGQVYHRVRDVLI